MKMVCGERFLVLMLGNTVEERLVNSFTNAGTSGWSALISWRHHRELRWTQLYGLPVPPCMMIMKLMNTFITKSYFSLEQSLTHTHTQNLPESTVSTWKNKNMSTYDCTIVDFHHRNPQSASRVAPRNHSSKHQHFPWENVTSWWFQPIWKIFVKMGIFPNFRGKNKEYLSCHHLVSFKTDNFT